MTHFLLQDLIEICPNLISLGLLQSTSKNVSLLLSVLTSYCSTLAQYSYCLLKSAFLTLLLSGSCPKPLHHKNTGLQVRPFLPF